MRQQKEKRPKEKRRINDLPPKQKELTKAEARKVRGGGGVPGGVVTGSATGEEIPQ